ncbi:DUF2059 domain-containing protein [Pseudoxanthomonas sp. PXM01]|uniref:DUF2059 domain-containing protein n=1 Tax=Pseudoxanthomonas sp. PXM01 TaxID=2769295 RepID=UPI0017819C46|nr:DUF2059 domain-containing protein [Pseudoxanthomonas sp. PXM01]MBD9470206.1 DUF2059 domain-containing protein [Pseudoxanthomonas sp. PXM01]
MFKQGMTRGCAIAACLAAAAVVPAQAAGPSHGLRLADAMGFDQAFQDNVMVCHELAAKYDADAALKNSPDTLGGIKRGDPEFAEAEAAYAEMIAASCDYDQGAVKEAFVRTLDENLSVADADAVVAFYATDLGQRFLRASLLSNIVSSRALKTKLDTEQSGAIFGEKIAALVSRRPPPASDERVAGTAKTLPSADAAVALSDRIMQHIVAGTATEGFDLALPYALATKAQMGAFIEQLSTHQSTWGKRFGKSTGYELLRNDTVGDSMLRSVFLHRFDEHAIVWYFIWYRGTKGWVMSRFVFLEDSATLFH